MQYELPRYIEEEAKVLGPLSLKQFMIGFAGIVACALFFFFFRAWLASFLSLVLMSAIIFLMFGKVQGRPATAVILGLIKYIWLPKVFIWQKPGLEVGEVYVERLRQAEVKPAVPESKLPRVVSREEITELAKQLDRRDLTPEE